MKLDFQIRRGAVSALRYFPKGCGRPKSKPNPNPNHVPDVDLESKGKEVKVESGLNNNDNESENLSREYGMTNKNAGEELSNEKLVNGNSEELCTMEEARDGYLKEESLDLKVNIDEIAEEFFDSKKISDPKVSGSKIITDQNVSMKFTDPNVKMESSYSKIINDQNIEVSFDSKLITDQNVELSDSKAVTDRKNVEESFHPSTLTDGNVVDVFDSADENVAEDLLGSKINTDENVHEAFDPETNTVENAEAFSSKISTNEHAVKEASDSKENMGENIEKMTFVSKFFIDGNVEESFDSMEITDENDLVTFDSKKITNEDVNESFDSKEVTDGNVKESFDSMRNTDENAKRFNSIKSIDENVVDIFDSENFPDGNVDEPLEPVNGDVKKGPSNMRKTHFGKRKGQLLVSRHFPVGCGRNVPVENKVSSLVVEQIETAECKVLDDESEAGAIVIDVCDDVNNIVESCEDYNENDETNHEYEKEMSCEDNNEDDETNHEYEKGKSSIGEKKQPMELEAQAPRKLKKEYKGKGMNGDVTVDLFNKKSSGAKVVKKKFSKVVARKSAGNEATNIKRKLVDEELDDSLEYYTDKLFVQALTSSDDSPWRNDKKPSGIISDSATPKPKRKKASYSRTFFSDPRQRNNGKSSVDDDVLHQDDGHDKALTMYNGPRDLCINMIPTVSTKLILGGSSSTDSEAASRRMVKRALRMYQLLARRALQENEKLKGNSKDKIKSRRYDLDAAKIMKINNEFVNHGEAKIGAVPGVHVGDEFHFRTELSVVGLHRPYQAGIDYAKINGRHLALSVVASGGYPDNVDGSDVLIYTGSGGNPSASKTAKAENQKLERGNLALKNCIDFQSPVRVIYGVKESSKADALDSKPKLVSTFTYDGLYLVERYWTEKGNNDFSVFKFQLRRIRGQPEISLKEIMKVNHSKERVGVIANDISGGNESVRICAINTVDNERPMPFNYIKKVIYPSSYVPKPSAGCDCKNGCMNSDNCACAVKNGGSIPYNFNGAIVEAKVLVYECGPNCKCPPSCYNRVSQFGINLPLEIFKTETRGWGVRSLASIPSGTFVCEYVGEMLDSVETERRDNDEYLFDIGNNYDDHSLWDGLPSYVPGAYSSDVHESMENGEFTIDAAKFGNVGRFINHSCTPNLFAQNALYDHDDRQMPHIMFFAADNIPPLKELNYHYNYTVDQVRDENGNIKKKQCFCGSLECTGRLY